MFRLNPADAIVFLGLTNKAVIPGKNSTIFIKFPLNIPFLKVDLMNKLLYSNKISLILQINGFIYEKLIISERRF